MGEYIRVFLTKDEISARIKDLANKIAKDYKKQVSIVCILKGSFVFCADLIRSLSNLGCQTKIDFMVAKSYDGKKSTGDLRIDYFNADVTGKNILIVEDILDTGLTLKQTKEILLSRGAKSIKICTLLDKPSRRKVEMSANYVGFEVPDLFVVGYGIDYNEKYRELDYVGVVE